jgi:hypothetical protein
MPEKRPHLRLRFIRIFAVAYGALPGDDADLYDPDTHRRPARGT